MLSDLTSLRVCVSDHHAILTGDLLVNSKGRNQQLQWLL